MFERIEAVYVGKADIHTYVGKTDIHIYDATHRLVIRCLKNDIIPLSPNAPKPIAIEDTATAAEGLSLFAVSLAAAVEVLL